MRHLQASLTLLVLAALAANGDARADSATAECAQAAEQAQKLQSNGQLVDAKKKLLVCVRSVCPKVIQNDCTKWEVDVEAALPSVVFGVKDENGNDITDVSVEIDGEPVIDELTGTSTPIDPGSHKFVFKREGQPPLRVTALIRQGEKNRLVTARWGSGGPSGDGKSGAPSHEGGGHPRPVLGYVLLGVGVALGAVAAYGFASGESAVSGMQSGCGLTVGGCSSSQVSGAQGKLWIGDIGAPLAGVSLALGAYLLIFTGNDTPVAKVGVSAGVAPGGGFVSWQRRF